MSDGLVIELQRDAMGSTVPISELLRKAMVVARKLGNKEFQQWVELELNGYKERDKIPDYRNVTGELSVWNPYHGWQPVLIGDNEIGRHLTIRPVMQEISEIEHLANTGKNKGGSLTMPFPPAIEAQIIRDWELPLRPVLRLDANQLHGIIEAVRNTILQWTLNLEDAGVIGKGMTFSDDEKNRARSSPNINIGSIGTFQGNLGSISQSTVSQKFDIGKSDWDALNEYLKSLGIVTDDANRLKNALDEDGPPKALGIFGGKVSEWIGGMTTKAMSGTWKLAGNIATGAAGQLLAEAIKSYYWGRP